MKISDFVKPELEMLLSECNFTKDEEAVFTLLSRGNTTENVAEMCNMSISTTKRIKKRIWAKIGRIMNP